MTQEALKLALEALHGFIPYLPLNDEVQCGRYDQAITAIKEALREHALREVQRLEQEIEQEPVAWEQFHEHMAGSFYTSPPQRTWVGLTDEERDAITDKLIGFNSCWGPEEAFAAAIEAKLKEKNT
jgi:hypothetical protein